MEIPPIIFQYIRFLTAALMGMTILSGCGTAILVWLRRGKPSQTANFLFLALLGTFSLTLANNLFAYWGVVMRHPRLNYLPMYYTLAFGPLLFFYVKSRLYPNFRLQRNDLKHFILPLVQFVLFSTVKLRGLEFQNDFHLQFFNPFYGNFEKAIFLVTFSLYAYFSFIFVKHEHHYLLSHREKTNRRQILIVGWLRRMVKVTGILFMVYASFVLVDYFSYRLFDLNLQSKALFSTGYELSFASMVLWLAINAFFAWQRKI